MSTSVQHENGTSLGLDPSLAVPAGAAPASDVDVAGDYRCLGCGYGIVVATVLPRCPMCGLDTWRAVRRAGGAQRVTSAGRAR